MEQTIKINVHEGKVAVYNPDTNTVDFVDKEPIRSKSWEEFCNNCSDVYSGECFIKADSSIDVISSDRFRGIRSDKNLLASKEDAEGILALIQLTRLHDEWVGNWKPDWTDIGTTKYSIQYYSNNIYIYSASFTHHLLSFPTNEMAEEFLNCFRDLIVKAKRFI